MNKKLEILRSISLNLSSKREKLLIEIDILLETPSILDTGELLIDRLTVLFLELEKYDTCMKSVNSILEENLNTKTE
jgi:hypothetical protein